MNTLAEIENAVIHLSKNDFSKFRDWFDALKNKKWDQEFEADAANGLLDSLADEALSDFNSGRIPADAKSCEALHNAKILAGI